MATASKTDTFQTDNRIKELRRSRGSIKAKLTIFDNFIKQAKSHDKLSEILAAELDFRLSKIEALYADYDQFQNELEMLSDKPEELYFERGQFEQQYFSLVSIARTIR